MTKMCSKNMYINRLVLFHMQCAYCMCSLQVLCEGHQRQTPDHKDDFGINTSLAAPGALAHRLQHPKWPLGGQKMDDGVC